MCVLPTQCTFLHAIHSDCVVLHCLYTFCPAAPSISVVYIYVVIGCLGGAVIIVGLVILVAIVLVCIFRGQL